jgi:hypothetical protein
MDTEVKLITRMINEIKEKKTKEGGKEINA